MMNPIWRVLGSISRRLTLAIPVTMAAGFVYVLIGSDDLAAIFGQIVVIVFLPMLAGHLTRGFLVARHGRKGFQENWAPRFPALSTFGVLGSGRRRSRRRQSPAEGCARMAPKVREW